MKIEIEQKQTNRFTILYALYKEANGSLDKVADLSVLGADNGIKNGNFKEAFKYLLDEKYILGKSKSTAITHAGKKIVEFIVTHPEERVDNFPPFNEMGI